MSTILSLLASVLAMFGLVFIFVPGPAAIAKLWVGLASFAMALILAARAKWLDEREQRAHAKKPKYWVHDPEGQDDGSWR